VPDPAAAEGTETAQRRAFRDAYFALENRIKLFVALPVEKLDRISAATAQPRDWSYHDIGH
jgi:hypothetical protein